MMRSCSYCGRFHPIGATCPKKPPRKTNYKPDKQLHNFRGSAAWTEARGRALQRDYFTCRWCFHLDPKRQPLHAGALQVHHIQPLSEAWEKRTDLNNLITLCTMHHAEAERGDIAAEDLKELARKPLF